MKALALVLVSIAPAAAAPIALSEVPAARVRLATPGALPDSMYVDATYIRVSDDAKGCFVRSPNKSWLDGNTDLEEDGRYRWAYSTDQFGYERLVVRGGKTALERTRIDFASGALGVSARSYVALAPIAKVGTVDIYTYRFGKRVFLIVPTADNQATVAYDHAEPGTGHIDMECGYGITALRVRADGSSQAIRLSGKLPTGKPYQIDASISKSSRDPEPLLSITTRVGK